MGWASDHDASIEKLQKVQGSLTVGLIIVRRSEFLCCQRAQTAAFVKEINTQGFSFLPVVDDDDRIIGLYNAERWFESEAPDEPIDGDYLKLSEEIVIGANASIFDFIRNAHKYSTKLVVSGDGVSGLVSLSDIQQLPVRAALFALVTSLEMAMSIAIEEKWPRPDAWIGELSSGRQNKLKDEIEAAKKRDGFVSEITFTQLSDKTDLLLKGNLISGSKRSRDKEMTAIRRLRDNLAHANSYADTPDAAAAVCAIVRSIYRLKDELIGRTA
ncbi:MAG: hypothetical protein ABJK59_11720 [Erythrobacter sp.]|uniref:hypothetical protein n=1 Tax=Erythrobacter sp. TaxID=1042 RepID=UPI0032981B74